ncbi:MAG: hypothetical protein UY07_C0025G0006 [Parcubacteria group bacterium GW2011_GWA1_47_8]|nr:MAG: hypothetical protein UY07_C0025G0006 [Parcubacteria group bacterium GW2011_GWA1_47_8]
MKNQKNTLVQTVKVIVLATILSLGLSYAYAWTAPNAAPPGGNVGAPINTGNSPQKKAGNLTLDNTLFVGGLLTASGGLDMNIKDITNAWAIVANSVAVNKLQVVTGAGAGKVLTSIDAAGNVEWRDAAAGTTPTSETDTLATVLFRGNSAESITINAWNIDAENLRLKSNSSSIFFGDGTQQSTAAIDDPQKYAKIIPARVMVSGAGAGNGAGGSLDAELWLCNPGTLAYVDQLCREQGYNKAVRQWESKVGSPQYCAYPFIFNSGPSWQISNNKWSSLVTETECGF